MKVVEKQTFKSVGTMKKFYNLKFLPKIKKIICINLFKFKLHFLFKESVVPGIANVLKFAM